MELETRADPDDEYPRWVLLENGRRCEAPDAATAAESRTSDGRPVRVSFGFAPPPTLSRLRVDSPGSLVEMKPQIIAAHGDSVLIRIDVTDSYDCDVSDDAPSWDLFVYNAGDAAAGLPPSLLLLPPCYIPAGYDQRGSKPRRRFRHSPVQRATALISRGHKPMVAELELVYRTAASILRDQAELCLFRSGKWELKTRLPVIVRSEDERHKLTRWVTRATVPAGGRPFVCWVDYGTGVIFSDLSGETPKLHFVPLPAVEIGPPFHRVAVCATGGCGGGGEVRIVQVSPRCCCGCPGISSCARSRHAFNITTWALRMEDTAWHKAGVVDCGELWAALAAAGYDGVIPRIPPEHPVVSLFDPDMLCFTVHRTERHADDDDVHGDCQKRAVIELDTRRMEVRSVFCYDDDDDDDSCTGSGCPPAFIPSTVSRYFDSRVSAAAASPRHRQQDILEAPAKPIMPADDALASPREMLAVLREIPGLSHDDMMRAYSVLAYDESRQFRFRSLLELPMETRKDYCLLIGKLSCFNT